MPVCGSSMPVCDRDRHEMEPPTPASATAPADPRNKNKSHLSPGGLLPQLSTDTPIICNVEIAWTRSVASLVDCSSHANLLYSRPSLASSYPAMTLDVIIRVPSATVVACTLSSPATVGCTTQFLLQGLPSKISERGPLQSRLQ